MYDKSSVTDCSTSIGGLKVDMGTFSSTTKILRAPKAPPRGAGGALKGTGGALVPRAAGFYQLL